MIKRILNEWKPIHLCWWFEKHNFKIPRYFIGKKPPSTPPTVTTEACTDVTDTSVTGNGTIVLTGTAGKATERGFCYIQGVGVPTTADTCVWENDLYDVGVYSLPITGLTQLTEYSVRAYAKSLYGTGYGAIVYVTTTETPLDTTLPLPQKPQKTHKRVMAKPR